MHTPPVTTTTPVLDKPWGQTRCVHRDATHEVWHASIVKGGYSSRHYHARKPNLFYLLSGHLLVRVFDRPPDTTPAIKFYFLLPGDQVTVEDGVWHQFEAMAPSELIEVYWTGLKGEDIVRADEGGVR